MSTLPVASFCYYLTEIDCQWRGIDYDARNIVKGVKKEPFNGRSTFTISKEPRTFDAENIDELVRILMNHIGKVLLPRVADGPISIVPIPNSGMAVGVGGEFQILELAKMVARGYAGEAEVAPILRWATPREKKHKAGGYRDPDIYFDALRVSDRPRHPIIIFDDVFTSGAQMTAAARKLREEQLAVHHGLVVGRTTKTQHSKMIDWVVEDLDIDPQTFDLSDFFEDLG